MIPSFTLARKGQDWELLSAGNYDAARLEYQKAVDDKFAHNYDEVVMCRIRKRKRFGDRVRVLEQVSSDDSEPETETAKPARKKAGRPKKQN